MNVLLKPDLEKFIDEQVRQGRFDSADDAINAAVAQLQVARQLITTQRDQMRAEVDIGIAEADRGDFVKYTAEDVIAQRHAALALSKKGK